MDEEESKDEDHFRKNQSRNYSFIFDNNHDEISMIQNSMILKEIQPQGSARSQYGPGHNCRKQIIIKLEDGLPDLKICIEDVRLTCGWLIGEVTKRYAFLIELQKQDWNRKKNQGEQVSEKIKKKIIAAIKSQNQNESLDYWLTLYNRSLSPLWDGARLEVHFTKIIPNKTKQVCLNDFQQLKVIGRGGFSKVFLVRKKDSGLLFAMKVMQKSFVMTDGKFKQVMSERNIMGDLDHPFVVKLHWAFQSRDELNFIMDLCAGGELFYLLHQRGRMNEEQAKFYFAEILLGLEYIHSKGIVYRDLKPENVLLDIDGHLKLADFGLSKVLPSIASLTNSFCGSPEYMSPEMLLGYGHGFAVDYYSLGAILFEMLTGLPPFYSMDRNQMYQDICEEELEYPDYLNPLVVDLLMNLLNKDQTQRYSFSEINLIKSHPWCADIDWNKVLSKQIEPPWLPSIQESNFDPEYTSLPLDFSEQDLQQTTATKGKRQLQRSYYCCIDQSAMTSFYDSHAYIEHSGILNNNLTNSGYYEGGPSQLSNIYSSRGRLLEVIGNTNSKASSAQATKEVETAIDTMFRGFSMYSEPFEEREIQRQISEYLKMKNQVKRQHVQMQANKKHKSLKRPTISNEEKLSTQIKNNIPKSSAQGQAIIQGQAQLFNPQKNNVVLEKAMFLSSIKQATNVINQYDPPQRKDSKTASLDQTPLSLQQQQLIIMKRLEQSSIIFDDGDVSIAQEFSRIEDDPDVDERPTAANPIINHPKTQRINQTTENSLSRANNLNSKVFELKNSYMFSPSGSLNHTKTQMSSGCPVSMRFNTKSSDSTPFNNERNAIKANENSQSIIGQSLITIENSNKKPKFLDKFNTQITKYDMGNQKKNLMEEFSPLSVHKHNDIKNEKIITQTSSWCSPNKNNGQTFNDGIEYNMSYNRSICDQKQIEQSIIQGFSRNNSGGIGGTFSVNQQNQRSSLISEQNSHDRSVQQKSRNASQNFHKVAGGTHTEKASTGSNRSTENSLQAKRSLLYHKQKPSQHLSNLTPFSAIENIQNNTGNNGQQSFCQKPPRQNQSISSNILKQPSVQKSETQQNGLNTITQSTLTAYQRQKTSLTQNRNSANTLHQSLKRGNPNISETQMSSHMQPGSLNSTSAHHLIEPKSLKFQSSTNVSQFSMTDQIKGFTPKSCQISNIVHPISQSQQRIGMGKQEIHHSSLIDMNEKFSQTQKVQPKSQNRAFSKESENKEPIQVLHNDQYYKRNDSLTKKYDTLKGKNDSKIVNDFSYKGKAKSTRGKGYLTLK